jgi:hypothetical protein
LAALALHDGLKFWALKKEGAMKKVVSQPGKSQSETSQKKRTAPEPTALAAELVGAALVQVPDPQAAPDPRRMIAHQKLVGNRAVLRLIATPTASGESRALQRVDGEEEETAAPARYQVTFGRIYNLVTLRDAFDLSYDLSAHLHDLMEDMQPSQPEYQDAHQWLVEIAEAQRYLGAHDTEPVNEFAFTQINLWFQEFLRVERALREVRNSRISADLADARRRIESFQADIDSHRADLNEAMRAAYLSGDSDAIADMSNFIGSVVGLGMGLRDMSREIADALAELSGITTPAPSRYISIFENANRVLTAVNTVYTLAHLDAPTEMGAALNEVNAGVTLFSAAGTFLGFSAHIGLITDLYIAPMVQVITARLNAILDRHLHELNLVSQEIGWGVEMSNEPGGTAMYTYLTQVMRAGSAEEISWPPPEEVSSYLVSNRENISAGAGSDLPTERSWLLWHNLDESEGRVWVFEHRSDLWHMFYGALSLPRGGR